MSSGGIEKKKTNQSRKWFKTKQIAIKKMMNKFENKLKKFKWGGIKSKTKSN
jgi:hypothetical protein